MSEIVYTPKELINTNLIKVMKVILFVLMTFTFYCLYTYFDGLKVGEFRIKNLLISLSTAALIMFLPPIIGYQKYRNKKKPSSEN
jgi:hypothetical protein